jgi:hypothetical protein
VHILYTHGDVYLTQLIGDHEEFVLI